MRFHRKSQLYNSWLHSTAYCLVSSVEDGELHFTYKIYYQFHMSCLKYIHPSSIGIEHVNERNEN